MKKKGSDEVSTEIDSKSVTLNISWTKVAIWIVAICTAIWGYVSTLVWYYSDKHNDVRYIIVGEYEKRTADLEKRATRAEELAKEARELASKTSDRLNIIDRDNVYRDKRLDQIEEVNKKQWQMGRKP